jgi:lysozyme family protein
MIQQKPASPDSRDLYLQRLLKSAGYEFGPVDGIVGKKTKAAITRFQKAASLPETGEFDAPTVAKLRYMFETPMKEVALEAQKMAHPRPSPPGIKATPSKLRDLGSRTIANADAGQIATGITAMTGVIGIASEVAKAAKSAQGVFAELIAVWPYALILAAAIFAYLAFRTAKRIRVDEHNEGVNISRRVLADPMDDELVADVAVNLVTRQ